MDSKNGEFVDMLKHSAKVRDSATSKIEDIIRCQFALLLDRKFPSERLIELAQEVAAKHAVAQLEDHMKKDSA